MKQKIFVNKEEVKKEDKNNIVLEVFLDIFVYALILMLASSIFEGFYIENLWYALLASVLIGVLNLTIKPVLIYLTLPFTVMTMGIFYPVVNIIVLKIVSLLLGSHFIVEGFIVPFFIAIFISILKIVFELIIVKPILRRD